MRTLVMGIVNVTPDSFSDGGEFFGTAAAVEHGIALVNDGADILDIGGESTRPGSAAVTPEEETRRVVPVIQDLAAHIASQAGSRRDGSPAPLISVDTRNASTARAAVEAGADIINDVSGGLADPDMFATAVDLDVPYILQHTRGTPDGMNELAEYTNVVDEVVEELRVRIEAALDAGITQANLIIDPGLGFAKDSSHNWALLAHLDRLAAFGYPVLIGASRKRFLVDVVPEAVAAEAKQRDAATAAITMLSAQAGMWGVRVHEVRASRDVIAVVEALRNHV